MQARPTRRGGYTIGFFLALAFLAVPLTCAAQEKIAFASTRDGNYEIYAMNPDGTDQTRLTENTAQEANPVFSPDGSKIAFVSDRDGNAEIYVMNADGTNQVRLTTNPALDNNPSFSGDGSKIAFCSYRDGAGEIYVMNADGTNQINVTNHPEEDSDPSFSPDNSKIAFRSSRDFNGFQEIYVMNADGSNQTRLTFDPRDDATPSFSPDSSKICFIAGVLGDDIDIYVMNADGTNEIRLTDNAEDELRPAFSPDGSRIVYETILDGGNYELYEMNADGTNQVRITFNPAEDLNPAWGGRASNLPALSNVAVTSPISENDTATLSGKISDASVADNFTLTVDWGDGSELQHFNYPAGTVSFSETHQYADDNLTATGADVYSIILTLNDHNDGADTESTSVTVNNLAPTLSDVLLSPSTMSVGGTAHLSGVVSDAGTQDSHVVQIIWNDGSPTTTLELSAGGAFNVNHQFNTSGKFTVRITVNDDDGGQTGGGASITVNPVLTLPNAPEGLTATGVSTSRINLQWTDNSNNETSFIVERCQANKKCANFIQIAPVSANTVTFSDTGLTANTTYFYRVRAFNSAGYSAYSNTASAKTARR